MKNKIIKICEEYNWTFKGETSKGWTVENNALDGHIIVSPTLDGLYNCMIKWVVNETDEQAT